MMGLDPEEVARRRCSSLERNLRRLLWEVDGVTGPGGSYGARKELRGLE